MHALMVFSVFQNSLPSTIIFFYLYFLKSTIINFLFASLKLLTYFENAYWNPPQNSLLCDWSMFSSADLSLAAEKMRLESTQLYSHFTLPLTGIKMACQCTQYAFVFKQMQNFPRPRCFWEFSACSNNAGNERYKFLINIPKL